MLVMKGWLAAYSWFENLTLGMTQWQTLRTHDGTELLSLPSIQDLSEMMSSDIVPYHLHACGPIETKFGGASICHSPSTCSRSDSASATVIRRSVSFFLENTVAGICIASHCTVYGLAFAVVIVTDE